MNTKTTQNLPPAASVTLERLAFTKSELCSALGLAPISIYRLEQRGLLRPIAGIRHKLFAVAEVNRFLAGRVS